MKRTLQDYLKIALTILIIAGMFMPYTFGISPFEYIFEGFDDWDWEFLFVLPIPLMMTLPLLILLIFKNSLKASIAKILNAIFSILYIAILAENCYLVYSNYLGSSSVFGLGISIAVILSLILLLLSLKYSISSPNKLQNMFLAIMGFPIILYFIIGSIDLNYGGFIITTSFLTLYIMAIIDIFKNRSVKDKQNQP